MRWTLRGIDPKVADAVRDVSAETGSTQGEVIQLCIKYGLAEACRYLGYESTRENELISLVRELKRNAQIILQMCTASVAKRAATMDRLRQAD